MSRRSLRFPVDFLVDFPYRFHAFICCAVVDCAAGDGCGQESRAARQARGLVCRHVIPLKCAEQFCKHTEQSNNFSDFDSLCVALRVRCLLQCVASELALCVHSRFARCVAVRSPRSLFHYSSFKSMIFHHLTDKVAKIRANFNSQNSRNRDRNVWIPNDNRAHRHVTCKSCFSWKSCFFYRVCSLYSLLAL